MRLRGLPRARLPWLCLLLGAGCGPCDPAAVEQTCEPACPAGFVCQEEGQCVSRALPLVGPTGLGFPGRGVRLQRASPTEAWVGVIDPNQGRVLVGRLAMQVPEQMTLLSDDVRAGTGHLAMATSATTIALAWIDAKGVYTLATRPLEAGESWGVEKVAFSRGQSPSYGATDDFDLRLEPGGEPLLVFRDRRSNRLLWSARSREDTAIWAWGAVDEKSVRDPLCTEALRAQRGLGVGYGPRLVATPQGTAVVYHDADCGDLRFAQRTAQGRWQVDVIETGGDTTPGDRISGVSPSAAIDAKGVLWIAYHDASRLQLGVTTLDGGKIRKSVVDQGERLSLESQRQKKIVGAFPVLRLGEQGTPRVVYFDGTETALMSAEVVGSAAAQGWTTSVIDATGIVGVSSDQVQLDTGQWVTAAEQLMPTPQGLQSVLRVYVEEAR